MGLLAPYWHSPCAHLKHLLHVMVASSVRSTIGAQVVAFDVPTIRGMMLYRKTVRTVRCAACAPAIPKRNGR